jgi:hypothetical protein
MATVNLSDAWRSNMAKGLEPGGLFDVVKSVEREGLFKDWSRSTVPFSSYYLNWTIDLLCGAPEQTELVATFLGYVRQQIERAKSEPGRWDCEENNDWGSPFMKAERWYDFLRADLYSRALLGGSFDPESQHFEALQASANNYGELPTRFWDELYQARLIECGLVAAAWGRLDMAQSILKIRRSFKPTQRYADWARSLIAQLIALSPGETVSSDSALWTHFHSLFDQIRHPTLLLKTGEVAREAARRGEAVGSSSWPLWRLALAMLKQRYFLGKPVDPGMRDLIGLIVE